MNIFETEIKLQYKNDDEIGISVLIPLYNGVEYLEQSLSSVINQTYHKWQLIIGINGHLENSEIYNTVKNIYNKLDKDKKFNILIKHYDTQGKSKTLNKMVDDCIYDYIAILDVDDYWVPNKLELQIPILKKGYDVVGGKCQYFGERKGTIPQIPVGDFSTSHDIFSANPIINSSVIIKKTDAIWDDENYVPAIGLDDYSMWFKFFLLKKKFYNLDIILCYHRIHTDSAFNFTNNDNINKLKQLWYDYYKNHGRI